MKLVKDGKIILDGTLRECEKEKLAFEKLEKIQDFEEELGIDLIILLEALKEGIWIQEVHDKKKTIHVKVTLYHLLGFTIPYEKRYDKEGNYFGSVRYFCDYKRTWALTKEDLEERQSKR